MTYIETGDEQTHRLSFYLAMEEYIARHLLHQDDCFFMWQVEPSVIFGRNQVSSERGKYRILYRAWHTNLPPQERRWMCLC